MLRITQTLPAFTEPISLAEAKSWLSIDFTDFDTLISGTLIPSAREQSEKQSGQAYFERTINIAGNGRDQKIYPIGPWISDVVDVDATVVTYAYLAGFTTLPADLRLAMLKRIATDFAFRQNQITEQAYNNEVSSSIIIENRYRSDLMI